jgi:hypothetical protein
LRGDYKIRDLESYVRANRARLLSAALTILWAYGVAGEPPVEMRHLGTYERWSRIVRRPLIWAGCADPATTQDALLESSVNEDGDPSELLDAWHACFADKPMSIRDVVVALSETDPSPALSRLKTAIGVTCELKKGDSITRPLGAVLKRLRDGIRGAYRLEGAKGRDGVRWRVVLVDCNEGVSGDSCESQKH